MYVCMYVYACTYIEYAYSASCLCNPRMARNNEGVKGEDYRRWWPATA